MDPAKKYILKVVAMLDPSGFNTKLYEGLFASMSDKEFNKYKTRLKNKEQYIELLESTGTDHTIDALLDIADKLGVKIFQKITSKIPGTDRSYTLPFERKVLMVMVRRAQQDGEKGITVPLGNKKRDPLTGQASGSAKGSTLTLPENRLLLSFDTPAVVKELNTFRTGDLGARNAANAYYDRYGAVRLSDLEPYRTTRGSTILIQNYFKGAHIGFKTEPVTGTEKK